MSDVEISVDCYSFSTQPREPDFYSGPVIAVGVGSVAASTQSTTTSPGIGVARRLFDITGKIPNPIKAKNFQFITTLTRINEDNTRRVIGKDYFDEDDGQLTLTSVLLLEGESYNFTPDENKVIFIKTPKPLEATVTFSDLEQATFRINKIASLDVGISSIELTNLSSGAVTFSIVSVQQTSSTPITRYFIWTFTKALQSQGRTPSLATSHAIEVGTGTLASASPSLGQGVPVGVGAEITIDEKSIIHDLGITIQTRGYTITGRQPWSDFVMLAGTPGSVTFASGLTTLDRGYIPPAGIIEKVSYAPANGLGVSPGARGYSVTGNAPFNAFGFGEPVGAVSAQGVAPTFELCFYVPVYTDLFSIFGRQPSFALEFPVGVGILAIEGYTPFWTPDDDTASPSAGSTTITSYAVTLAFDMLVEAGALSVTTYDLGIFSFEIPATSLSITSYGMYSDRGMPVDPTALIISVLTPTINVGPIIDVGAGGISLD